MTGPETCAAACARDGYMCVCCGTPIVGRTHSAVLRSKRGPADDLRNVLTFIGPGADPLDPDDHRARVESGIDPSDEAKGYTVRSWGSPALIPVMVFTSPGARFTAWLTDSGEYAFAPPEEAAA